jgi:hypothetical protein
VGVICEDSITPAERQAMDDSDMELTEFVDIVTDLDDDRDEGTGTFRRP